MKRIIIPVFSAFAGYDSQFMALRRFAKWFNRTYKGQLSIDFDLVGWCEIDPYAIMSHNILFPEYKSRHYNDIRKVMWGEVPDFTILIYSSCCQDITRNGKQAGLVKGSGTRSELIWNVLEALKIRHPQVAILENVPALLEKTFCYEFCKWQESVDEIGYRSCWGTLLASDFGIPQNRKRAFMISVREDIEQNIYFPQPLSTANLKRVETMLDDHVGEAYYYSYEDAVRYIIALYGKVPGDINCISIKNHGRCLKRIVTPTCKSGVHRTCPTLLADSCYAKKNYMNFISTGYFPGPAVLEVWQTSDNIDIPYSDYIASAEIKEEGEINIKNASKEIVTDVLNKLMPNSYFRLRRLTPSECFKLMGVDIKSVTKIVASSIPESEQYKLAGNAIILDTIFNLYKNLFREEMILEISDYKQQKS